VVLFLFQGNRKRMRKFKRKYRRKLRRKKKKQKKHGTISIIGIRTRICQRNKRVRESWFCRKYGLQGKRRVHQ